MPQIKEKRRSKARVADGRRHQPGFTEISSLDAASLLLGLIFCFRVEALKSSPVSSLFEAGLGLTVFFLGWARKLSAPRHIVFMMVPVLFIAQQIRASSEHPLDWWRSNILPVIEMAWHTLGKGENPYDSTLMIKQLLYWR